MRPEELRIGNLIQLYRRPADQDKTIHKIKWIVDGYVVLTDGFHVNYDTGIEPIPITEEWLDKFGFSEHGNKKVTPLLLSFLETDLCKHVHQLQNLYYALTGEELRIKEAIEQ